MSTQETFEIAAISFEFSPDSRAECRDGVLNAVFIAEAQRFDGARHGAFKDQSGVVQPIVRIRELTFPLATVERTLQFPEAADQVSMTLEGFSGMFQPRFAGTLQVADGWLVLDGSLEPIRPEQRTPLLIRKRFNPGPVDPRLHVHTDLAYALSIEPTLVRRLALLQSGGSVPPALFQLRHLEELTLRYFSDETLPDRFERLPELKRLTLMNMPFKELPPSIGALTALTELNIYDTHLDHLPDAVRNLSALESVSIRASRLREVPDCLFRLPALRSIGLTWNKLASLPESVGTTAALQEIYLEGNLFVSLPQSLANVPEVFIEAKFKPLYTKAAYKSRNRKKINQSLFTAATNIELAGSLDREIGNYGLLGYRADLLKVAHRAVVLHTTDADDYSTVGNTRFGGDPDLPRAVEYPMVDDEALVFLAQLDLAEVAPHQEYLPRAGLLSFFALLVEEEDFAPAVRVFYFPDTSDLVRRDSRHIAACQQKPFRGFRAIATPCSSLPFLTGVERQLFPTGERLAAIEENDDLRSRYEDLCNALLAEQIRNRNDRHGINTFVYAQVHTPEQLACEVHGGVAEEWMVLLSVASDDNPGFCFVDGGTLTFCIHKRDLAIADFSKVVASIESS